jgi:hypothetical protein
LFDGVFHEIKENVKYCLDDDEKNNAICFSTYSQPFVFSLEKESNNILMVEHKFNKYYFLFPIHANCFHTKIKYGTNEIELSINAKIVLSCSGEIICERDVFDLKFSHYEIENGFCFVYFVGKRNFVVVLKDKQLIFCDFYDECNISENEKLFMVKLYDSLNHGKVLKIKNKEFENYLVYLDDNELMLKKEFIAHVFLDCVVAGNFKYANCLLCDNLHMKDESLIEKFFPEFDWFYPIGKNEFVLTNKKALSGIFEFEIVDDKISNISCH